MKWQTILPMFIIGISQITNSAAAVVVYNLTPLGDLLGGSMTTPYWISDNGQIVGSGFPATGQYAAIKFDSTGGGQNIRLSQNYSCARSVNDRGQIVGYGYQGAGSIKPLLFDPTGNGNNIILATFSGAAYAINNSGQIVGASGDGESSRAWLFDIAGSGNNVSLGQGSADSISDNGLIAGSSHPVRRDGWHATLFDPTGGAKNVDLGKLFPTDDRSFATSVNDHGQIVGYSGGPDSGYTATLYDPTGNGNNIALGAIGDSEARCINNAGQIVGTQSGNATLFDITGKGDNINLNDLIDPSLGWSLYDAVHINENGWIIGTGNMGVYLLTPEPATLLLLGLGSLPLLRGRRRA